MSSDMKVIVGSLIVLPTGADSNDECATLVKLAEEGGGPFVEIEQHGRDGAMVTAGSSVESDHVADIFTAMVDEALK